MKRFIALVLSLVMTLSLCAPAWGAEPVTTEEELRNALSAGGDVVLGAEITVTSTLTVAKNTSVVLNLNGHNLSYTVDNNGKASAIIINNGTLEIEGNGTISFKATDPDVDYSPEGFPTYATNTITNEGTLTIGEGVVIANGSDGGASYAVDNKGSFTMNGGKLVGNRCALRVAKYNQDNVYFEMNGGIITALTPGWIQLPGGDGNVAPTITVEINGGVMQTTKTSSMENNLFYTYSYGNSHANTKITVNGGEFLGGVVSIGSGYKGDAPTLTITGGTFEYDVLKWTSDSSEVLYAATDAVFVHTPGELPAVEDGDIIIVTADGTYSATIDKAISFTVQPGGIATNVDLEITPATGYDMTTQEVDNGIKYTFVPLAAKVGDTYYKTLQAAVDAVKDGETITVNVSGETASVKDVKTFTVTGEAATIIAGEGYVVTVDNGVYTSREASEQEATASTNSAVKTDDVKDAVADSITANQTNTVTVVDSNNATTTIEFNEVDDDNGAAAKALFTATSTDISTKLTVDAEFVTEDVQDTAEEQVGKNAEIATYVDIDIHVLADGEHVGQITQLPMAIKVVIPASTLTFDKLENGYTRNVYVLRFHGTQVDRLPATLEADGSVSFESHLFSTYAVVYEDVPTYYGWSGYYPVVGGTSSSTADKTVTSAKTFDAGIGLYVAMSVMAAAGSAVVLKKRED